MYNAYILDHIFASFCYVLNIFKMYLMTVNRGSLNLVINIQENLLK